MEFHEPLNLSEFDIRSVTRFVELLVTVHERVSRPKVTSICTSTIGQGRIDKLVFKLPQNIQRDWLIKKCQSLNLRIEGRFLRDKKYYLSIYVGNITFDCLLGSRVNTEIFKVTVNPGKSSLYAKLEAAVLSIFGDSALESSIYRIDFCVDYRVPYLEIIEGLNVRDKQARIEHIGRPGRTGIQIGVNEDKIIVYDKAQEAGLREPLTRIERQISGEKVFIKTLKDLTVAKEALLKFDPMAIVSLYKIHFLDDQRRTQAATSRLNELKTLIEHEGYFCARKKLAAKSDNFERDYGKLFTKIPYDIQPSQILSNAINCYFSEVMQ